MTRTKTTPTTPTTPTTEWCVPYCRVSSEKQAAEERGSLDQQERDALETARKAGLRVLYVVKDAESAWVLDKRSKFQEVLRDAKAGKFSVLIVDRMNRLTRSEDLGEYMSVMAALREAGVRVLFSSREYDASPIGQFMQFADAYVSGQEQANRRKQALVGKRTRAHARHQPIPGSWPRYGYVWVDEKKTQMAFDPGGAQAVVRRIWAHFLTGEHPTLSGTAKQLSQEGVAPPRVYAGITSAKNARACGPLWNAETVRGILPVPSTGAGMRTARS
jgi:site-specific DNA recombinase